MRKLIAPLLGALTVLSVIGCAGSEAIVGTETNPRVRFLNATSLPTSVDAFIDDEQIGNELAFGQISNEAIQTNGNHTARVTNSSTGAQLVNTETTFEAGEWYTMVAYTREDGTTRLVNTRDNKEQTPGKQEIRVVRATDFYGDVDIYVYETGTPLPATPTATLAAAGQSSEQFVLDLNKTYTLRIFPSGQREGGFANENIFANAERNRVFYFTRNSAGVDTLLEFNE